MSYALLLDERETALYVKCLEVQERNPHLRAYPVLKSVMPLGDAAFVTVDKASIVDSIIDTILTKFPDAVATATATANAAGTVTGTANATTSTANSSTNPTILEELVLFERKSLNDLLASVKDGRYEEQSFRLLHAEGMLPRQRIVYIIEGMISQLTAPNQKITFSSMCSLLFFKGFNVMRTATTWETAQYLLFTLDKLKRSISEGGVIVSTVTTPPTPTTTELTTSLDNEVVDAPVSVSVSGYASVIKKVKKENITESNITEIILSQIPGVSGTAANAIVKHIHEMILVNRAAATGTVAVSDERNISTFSFLQYCRENPHAMDNIHIPIANSTKTRKINKSAVSAVIRYLGLAL